MLVRYVLLIYIDCRACTCRCMCMFIYANLLFFLSFFLLAKTLQMEGDIRSNSSDDVSDNSVNNTPVNSIANYSNKSNSRPKVH